MALLLPLVSVLGDVNGDVVLSSSFVRAFQQPDHADTAEKRIQHRQLTGLSYCGCEDGPFSFGALDQSLLPQAREMRLRQRRQGNRARTRSHEKQVNE